MANFTMDLEKMMREGMTMDKLQELFDAELFKVADKLEEEKKAAAAREKIEIQKKKDAQHLSEEIAAYLRSYHPDLYKKFGKGGITADTVIDVFNELSKTAKLVFKFGTALDTDPFDKFFKELGLR